MQPTHKIAMAVQDSGFPKPLDFVRDHICDLVKSANGMPSKVYLQECTWGGETSRKYAVFTDLGRKRYDSTLTPGANLNQMTIIYDFDIRMENPDGTPHRTCM